MALVRKLNNSNNFGVKSTNFMKRFQISDQDINSDNDSHPLQYSTKNDTQMQEQLLHFDDKEQTDEKAEVKIPYQSSKLFLISCLSSSKRNTIHRIQQKKRNFQQLLKKKQYSRQKFIQKINHNLINDDPINDINTQIQSIQSAYTIKTQIQNKNITKLTNKKVHRSQKQLIKDQKEVKLKYVPSSEIELTSVSKMGNSEKKRIKLKKRQSESSLEKNNIQIKKHEEMQNSIHSKQFQLKSNKKRQSLMRMSKNQFQFLQQYQKDQKQIMNRLLNIIQKQHQNKIDNDQNKRSNLLLLNNMDGYIQMQRNKQLQSSKIRQKSLCSSKRGFYHHIQSQYSSVKPIVINNYMKSPTEYLDKKLSLKQSSIRLLQQNRNKKRTMNNSNQMQANTFQNGLNNSVQKRPIQKQQKTIQDYITDKPQKKTTIQQFPQIQIAIQQQEINFQRLFKKVKEQTQSKSNKTNLKMIQIQNVNVQNKKLKQQSSERKQEQLQNQIFEGSYKSKLINKNQSHQVIHLYQPQIISNLGQPSTCQNDLKLKKKESIAIDIYFGKQGNQKQTINLAEAFKKKFGSKRSTKNEKHGFKNNQNNRAEGLSELKLEQNTQFLRKQTIKRPALRQKQNKIIQEDTNQKQNFNFIQTPRNPTQKHNGTTEQSICASNLSKQPSKQLIDRLIYGGKANISKKQMYSLTKKNYMKLPEIQEKRKIQEKKQQEIQRLFKVKEYQKRIRNSKNSIAKNSMKSSVKSSIEKDINTNN